MDGGMRSATNADLARGYGRVLILNPLGANANFVGGPAEEAKALEREGSRVLVIEPDAASAAAINPLDSAARASSAQAGHAQGRGREFASAVAAFWSAA